MDNVKGINPLRTVDGKPVKCPAHYQWMLEDVSAPDAGRTEDTEMQKMMLGQVVALNLKWDYLNTADVSAILKAFQSEYYNVTYLDPLLGDFVTKEFYTGNRTVPLYNTSLGLWENVSFKIIERKAKAWNKSTETWEDIN